MKKKILDRIVEDFSLYVSIRCFLQCHAALEDCHGVRVVLLMVHLLTIGNGDDVLDELFFELVHGLAL